MPPKKKGGKKGNTSKKVRIQTPAKPIENPIYRETFNSLDTHKRGKIGLDQIGYALRVNNQCPTEAEIQTIINTYMDDDAEEGEIPKVDFDEFCSIMKENWKTKEELQERILSAFLTFDKLESGLVDEAEMRNAMLAMGESIEDSEINEFLKEANCGSDGKIPYEDFAKHMLDAYPRPASKKKAASGKSKKSGKSSSKK